MDGKPTKTATCVLGKWLLAMEAAGIEPAYSSPERINGKRLTKTPLAKSVHVEHPGDSSCRSLTADDQPPPTLNASVQYLAEAWPRLQPHIREAILTLVDASLSNVDDEGRAL